MISEAITEYSVKTDKAERLLKIKSLDFSDNQYLDSSQWQVVGEKIFFNSNVFPIEQLSLQNCKINEAALVTLGE